MIPGSRFLMNVSNSLSPGITVARDHRHPGSPSPGGSERVNRLQQDLLQQSLATASHSAANRNTLVQPLGKDLPDHFATFRPRQSMIASLVKILQPLMIEPHQVQDRGMKIVHRRHVFFRAVREFVRGTPAERCLDTGPGKPGCKAGGIVIASAGPFLEGGHAAELGAPDHEGLFQQAPLFEVFQQRRGWLVQNLSMLGLLF